MRLRRLLLERYGHFAGRDIVLPPAGLLLLHGPNEAGKSTALAAIGDFLFGFPDRTPWDFQAEGKDLRIGAEVEDGHGTTRTLWRRKGRGNTLLGADGLSVDDGVLAPFLGGADRKFFEGMYGLDHRRLREGGDEIAAARGRVGEVLFQAGAAVAGLHRVRAGLEAQAQTLFTERAYSRPLNQAMAALKEARRDLRAAHLDAGAWTSLVAARDALAAQAGDLAARTAADRREAQRLARIRRVAPLLRRLQGLEAERAALGPVPPLAADAAERRRAAQVAQGEAAATLAALAEEAAPLGERLAVPPHEASVLAAAAAIEALAETRGAILKAAADLPRREDEAAMEEEALRRRLRELDLPVPADPAEALPPSPALAVVAARAAERPLLEERLTAARRLLTEAMADQERARAALTALPPATDPAPLAAALEAARGLGRIAEDLTAAARAEADARLITQEAVAALGWPLGDAPALASLPVPAEAEVTAAARAFARLEAETEAATRRRDEALAEVASHQAEAAAIAAGAPLPTPEAVAAARARRDQGWRLVRARHVDGTPAEAWEEAAFLAGGKGADGYAGEQRSLADAFTAAIAAADALADRRDGEAQRLAAHAAAEAAAARAITRAEAAAGDVAALAARRAEAEAAWLARWAPCGLRPAAPEAMREALRRHARVVAGLEAWRAAARRRDDLAARRDAAAARLHAALGEAEEPAEETWDALLERAASRLRALEATTAARAAASRAVKEAEGTAATRAAALNAAEAAHAAWELAWRAALAAHPVLARLAGRPPEAVRVLLDGLEAVRAGVRARDDLRRRIADMRADRATFAATSRRLAADLAPDLAPEPDDVDIAQALLRRLEAARAAARARDAARARLETLGQRRQQATEAARAAAARLQALCAEAGVETPDALPAVEARTAQASALDRAVTDARQAVLAAADGLSLPEAAAEVAAEEAGAGLDALPEALAAVEARLAAATGEAQALGQRQQEAADRLTAAEAQSAAAAAARVAALGAGVTAQANRWLALRLAGVLLGQAIERYRAAHQGPLMARGGALFATLTGGSFTALGVDYDKDDRMHLVGMRPDGRRVALDGLSEGTRDQLFLALRLAAVEMHAARGTPLPFIADDLLVHFDETRAAAALRALADLGRRVQVLFFTHERHLLDIAAATLPAGSFATLDLAGGG